MFSFIRDIPGLPGASPNSYSREAATIQSRNTITLVPVIHPSKLSPGPSFLAYTDVRLLDGGKPNRSWRPRPSHTR